MIQSKEGSEACFAHFKAYQKDMLDNPRKWFGKYSKTVDGEPQIQFPASSLALLYWVVSFL